MLYFLFLCIICTVCYKYYILFYKQQKVLECFKNSETKISSTILYITNCNLFEIIVEKELKKYVININNEDTDNNFTKRLHKIKGNLLLVINFDKLENNKMAPILKAISAYSLLQGNTVATYVPYKTKDNATLLALAGKNIIFGNYATMANTKIDPILMKILESYYGTKSKKFSENFFVDSAEKTTTCNNYYTPAELTKLNLNCEIEENVKSYDKNILKELMIEIEQMFDLY